MEIDESKFGKRKNNRGHRVDGVWVIGGVEKTPQRKCFTMVVPNRNMRTINEIIERFVLPGSIVRTDCWRAYSRVSTLHGGSLIHQTVNHSIHFITEDGVHTNTIEGKNQKRYQYNKILTVTKGTWSGIKVNCVARLRNKKMMPWVLVEFIWRRKHYGDLWGGLIKTLREVSFSRASRNEAYFTDFDTSTE